MLEQLAKSLVTLFLVVGTGACWWTMKREARRHDLPLGWDVADLAAGLVGAVACYVLVRPLVVFRAGAGIATDPTLFAIRSAAAFGLAAFLGCWLASMYLEKETDVDLPPSLRPLEERVYDMHFAIVPFVRARE